MGFNVNLNDLIKNGERMIYDSVSGEVGKTKKLTQQPGHLALIHKDRKRVSPYLLMIST